MRDTKVENLYLEMIDKLHEINGSLKESIQDLSESLICINNAIDILRSYFKSWTQVDDSIEITFFKLQKPRFCAWRIYVVGVHQIISAAPKSTQEVIKTYYQTEIDVINRFFHVYAFHYQYYLTNEQAMDKDFFLVRNRSKFPPGRELLPVDPDFSTELDYLYSVFRGYEMLQDFLIKRIQILNIESERIIGLSHKKSKRWVGEKVELVELAYGLYYTQRINGGMTDISDIVNWLEESFSIDLSQAYRMFVDITRRKKTSYTKFLDEMRNAIHMHIENTLKHKVGK